MSWKPEELLKHPNYHRLTDTTAQVPPDKAAPELDSYSFTVPGPPVGKPRMTQRDKWQKRPAVLRYRDYCDRIRAAAPKPKGDPYGIVIQAYIAMPQSWSEKKKAQYHGCAHQQKPDFDNIVKSVCDALLREDSVLAGGVCWKYWCHEAEERTTIRVLYDA